MKPFKQYLDESLMSLGTQRIHVIEIIDGLKKEGIKKRDFKYIGFVKPVKKSDEFLIITIVDGEFLVNKLWATKLDKGTMSRSSIQVDIELSSSPEDEFDSLEDAVKYVKSKTKKSYKV